MRSFLLLALLLTIPVTVRAQAPIIYLDTLPYTSEVLVGRYDLGASEPVIFQSEYWQLEYDKSLIVGFSSDEVDNSASSKAGEWHLERDTIRFSLKRKFQNTSPTSYGLIRFRIPADSVLLEGKLITRSTSITVLNVQLLDLRVLEQELITHMESKWNSMLEDWEDHFPQKPKEEHPLNWLDIKQNNLGQIARAYFNGREMYCMVKHYWDGMH